MKLKNTFRLFFAAHKVVLKDLIFRGIIALVFGVAAFFIVNPFLSKIIEEQVTVSLLDSVKKFIASFFVGGNEFTVATENLIACKDDFLAMLSGKSGEIYTVAIAVGVVAILFSAFYGISCYACSKSLDTYMNSLKCDGYITTVLENFGKAFWFQLLSTFVSFVWDVLVLVLAVCFFMNTFLSITVFALSGAVIIVLLGKALRRTVLNDFLPLVCSGEKVGRAFLECFKGRKKDFFSVFGLYLFAGILILYVNLSTLAFTFGAGLFLTIPASFVFVSCANLVVFYSRKKKKYYVDYNNIVYPSGLGLEEEKLIKGIDI